LGIKYLHGDIATHTCATKLMSAKFEMIHANCLDIDVWQELVDNGVSRRQARSHADIDGCIIIARHRLRYYNRVCNALIDKLPISRMFCEESIRCCLAVQNQEFRSAVLLVFVRDEEADASADGNTA
jgi:hypothetical protein